MHAMLPIPCSVHLVSTPQKKSTLGQLDHKVHVLAAHVQGQAIASHRLATPGMWRNNNLETIQMHKWPTSSPYWRQRQSPCGVRCTTNKYHKTVQHSCTTLLFCRSKQCPFWTAPTKVIKVTRTGGKMVGTAKWLARHLAKVQPERMLTSFAAIQSYKFSHLCCFSPAPFGPHAERTGHSHAQVDGIIRT